MPGAGDLSRPRWNPPRAARRGGGTRRRWRRLRSPCLGRGPACRSGRLHELRRCGRSPRRPSTSVAKTSGPRGSCSVMPPKYGPPSDGPRHVRDQGPPGPVRRPPRAALRQVASSTASVPHAEFRAKGEGVVATLYSSGKFVVQGGGPGGLRGALDGPRSLARRAAPKAQQGGAGGRAPRPRPAGDGERRGREGGLLRAAGGRRGAGRRGHAGAARRALGRGGLQDPHGQPRAEARRASSATRRSTRSGGWIPNEYNALYPEYPALNPMLADLHAEVIGQLAQPGRERAGRPVRAPRARPGAPRVP